LSSPAQAALSITVRRALLIDIQVMADGRQDLALALTSLAKAPL
jgi:hypothetical protein